MNIPSKILHITITRVSQSIIFIASYFYCIVSQFYSINSFRKVFEYFINFVILFCREFFSYFDALFSRFGNFVLNTKLTFGYRSAFMIPAKTVFFDVHSSNSIHLFLFGRCHHSRNCKTNNNEYHLQSIATSNYYSFCISFFHTLFIFLEMLIRKIIWHDENPSKS